MIVFDRFYKVSLHSWDPFGISFGQEIIILTGFIRGFDTLGTSCGPHARPRMHCRQRFSMYFVTRNGFLFTWRTRGKTICGQTILESAIWRHLDPPKIVSRIVFQKQFSEFKFSAFEKRLFGIKNNFWGSTIFAEFTFRPF